jgi:hypothetical protein
MKAEVYSGTQLKNTEDHLVLVFVINDDNMPMHVLDVGDEEGTHCVLP